MHFSPTDARHLRRDSLELQAGWINFNFETIEKYSAVFWRNLRLFGELSIHAGTLSASGQDLATHFAAWRRQFVLDLDEFLETGADLHKGLLRVAEGHTTLLDQYLCRTLIRAGHMSPWEGEVVFRSMKNAIESGDATMHGLTDSVADVVDLVEEQLVHSIEATAIGSPVQPPPADAA